MTPELTKPQAALEQLADLNQTLEKEKVQLTPEVEEYVRNHVRTVQDKLQAGQDVYERDLEFIPKVKMWVRMPKYLREKYKSIDELMKSGETKDVTMSDVNEANKRQISPKQWQDLLHVMEAGGEKKEWIDETFKFPGEGKIETEKNLIFIGAGLTRLPQGLKISGNLNLTDCTGLNRLSEELKVGGDLILRNCTGLIKLPEGLKVGGSLELASCTGLTELPEGLKVGGYLGLQGCTGLIKLPDELEVGRDLWIDEDLLQKPIKKDAVRLLNEGKIGNKIFIKS
jgi:hypothetical protein